MLHLATSYFAPPRFICLKRSMFTEPNRLLQGPIINLTRVMFALNKETNQRYQRRETEAKTQ
jgi:hypothetical protein